MIQTCQRAVVCNAIESFSDDGVRFLFLPATSGKSTANSAVDSDGNSPALTPEVPRFQEDDPGLSHQSQQILKSITHPVRRQEFLCARYLVRFATGLAVDPPRDSEGMIQWPDGLCGSVSHSLGDVLVATAPLTSCQAIGVDIERESRVSKKLAEKLCTAADLRFLVSEEVSLAEVFAAKEALFKCHYPLGRRRFWFLDAEIVSVRVHSGVKNLEVRALIDTGPLTPANSITGVKILPLQANGLVLAIARIITT